VSGYPRSPRHRDGASHRCWYCGDVLQSGTTTIDHVIPKSRGGLGLQGNTVYACRRCNATKDDLLLDEFREWITDGVAAPLRDAMEHLDVVRRLLPPETARTVTARINEAMAELYGAPIVFYGERNARRR